MNKHDDKDPPIGDDEFKDFLKQGSEDEEACLPSFLVYILSQKLEHINNLLKISFEHYKTMNSQDPLRIKLAEYLEKLMVFSTKSFETLDYIIVKEIEISEENEQDDEQKDLDIPDV
jgi:hypothetical protein